MEEWREYISFDSDWTRQNFTKSRQGAWCRSQRRWGKKRAVRLPKYSPLYRHGSCSHTTCNELTNWLHPLSPSRSPKSLQIMRSNGWLNYITPSSRASNTFLIPIMNLSLPRHLGKGCLTSDLKLTTTTEMRLSLKRRKQTRDWSPTECLAGQKCFVSP